ncbi:hypothetical protein Moror_14761 [Moniliophthora roreri MCA 2997]|uniref:Serine protease inhibitor n=1 Tax=Moniliophthora roreri (strain MCA 2997) TaxID=1381753 RepID=V2X7B7_MONRO|nr:hypothetical protein Moror_14761 [Moniliophthora roreri MCA 2997]
MSLKPGLYYIQNRRRYIGSSGEEPPNAQRVIVLPDGVRAPRWLVEKLDDDRYIIKVEEPDGSHASAATVDDKIFVRVEKSEAWHIIPDERGGKDSYVIASADERYKGWVAPEEPEDQILYRLLIVGPSFPPFYPPNETFQFLPVPRE